MNENENPALNPNQQNNNQSVPPQPSLDTPSAPMSTTAGLSQSITNEDTSQQAFSQTPPVGPTQTVTDPHRGAFHKRIGRLGYLLGHAYLFLLILAVFIPIFFLMPALSFLDESPLRIIFTIPLFVLGIGITALTFLVQLSLMVRRIHDLGHPWFWILLSLIPFVGFIFSLYLLLAPGKIESNQWGDPVSSLSFLTVLGLK